MPDQKPSKAETGKELNTGRSDGTSPSLAEEPDIAEMMIGAAVLAIVQRKRKRPDGWFRAPKNP